MCHQSVGLIQSIIERSGIPAVSISVLPEITARMELPRVLVVDRPLGYPLGAPGEPEVQRDILRAALPLLAARIEGRAICVTYGDTR
jgi:hypothetical protein